MHAGTRTGSITCPARTVGGSAVSSVARAGHCAAHEVSHRGAGPCAGFVPRRRHRRAPHRAGSPTVSGRRCPGCVRGYRRRHGATAFDFASAARLQGTLFILGSQGIAS